MKNTNNNTIFASRKSQMTKAIAYILTLAMLISAVFVFTPSMEVSAVSTISQTLYVDGDSGLSLGSLGATPVTGDSPNFSGTATVSDDDTTLTLTNFEVKSTAGTVLNLASNITKIEIVGTCSIFSDGVTSTLIESNATALEIDATAGTLFLTNTSASSGQECTVVKAWSLGSALNLVGNFDVVAGGTGASHGTGLFAVGATGTTFEGDHFKTVITGDLKFSNQNFVIKADTEGYYRTTATDVAWTVIPVAGYTFATVASGALETNKYFEINKTIVSPSDEDYTIVRIGENGFQTAEVQYVISIPAVITIEDYDTSLYTGEIKLLSSNLTTTRKNASLSITVDGSGDAIADTGKHEFVTVRDGGTEEIAFNVYSDLAGTTPVVQNSTEIATFADGDTAPEDFTINVSQSTWDSAFVSGDYTGTMIFSIDVNVTP
jgi:hypothetical protein